MSFSLKHFRLEEFACSCCGRNEINWDFVRLLDSAREFAGVSFEVTSGFRCEKHNREVGGSPTSSHLVGLASDISCKTSGDRFNILSGIIKVGFVRIGIGSNFIHIDNDTRKNKDIIWLYLV